MWMRPITPYAGDNVRTLSIDQPSGTLEQKPARRARKSATKSDVRNFNRAAATGDLPGVQRLILRFPTIAMEVVQVVVAIEMAAVAAIVIIPNKEVVTEIITTINSVIKKIDFSVSFSCNRG